MKIREHNQRAWGDENIVPMINIVFLLLIFFLLAGTLNPRPPFELDPVATMLQPPGQPPVNGLFVSANGDLYFSGVPQTLVSLPDALAAQAVGNDKPFEVLVDRRISAKDLFPIMSALGEAGITRIRLVTERNAGG